MYTKPDVYVTIKWLGATLNSGFGVFFCMCVCALAVTLSFSIQHLLAFLVNNFCCISDGVLPQVLYEVNLPILNNKECSRALSTLRKPIQGDTILCAGFPDGGKDACQVS